MSPATQDAALRGKPGWLVLDNHAKVWPAVLSGRYTSLFRLTALLKERIVLGDMQTALEDVIRRHPYFQTAIRKGFFWYHLENRSDMPRVEADCNDPCMEPELIGKHNWPFRVRVFNGRVSLEMSHIITDGTGALVFLCDLVRTYARIRGLDPAVAEPEDPGLAGKEGEWADDYASLDIGNAARLPRIPDPDRPWHPPGKLLPKGEYRAVSLWLPVTPVLALAKGAGVSLTEYMVSMVLMVMQDIQEKQLSATGRLHRMRPLNMNVPVNLRKLFPSPTLRNFFSYAAISIDPRLGRFTFDEILELVHHQMRFQVSHKRMRLIISRYLRSERALAIRLFPLVLKDLVLNLVYRGQADGRYTMTLSNLGAVPTMDGTDPLVEGFVFLPPPSPICRTNATLISWKDRLSLSFAGLTGDTTVARACVSFLTEKGIPVRVESNDPASRAGRSGT